MQPARDLDIRELLSDGWMGVVENDSIDPHFDNQQGAAAGGKPEPQGLLSRCPDRLEERHAQAHDRKRFRPRHWDPCEAREYREYLSAEQRRLPGAVLEMKRCGWRCSGYFTRRNLPPPTRSIPASRPSRG